MNKITRSIKILLGVFLFCIHYNTIAQTLDPPTINFGERACDPTGATNFTIDINFNTTVFNSDNKFIVELSDADGNFGSPVLLTEINSSAANTAFNINDVGFTLPAGTFGKNYRIRVRTTSPVRSAISTTSFEAYHDIFGESELEINGLKNFVLCDGGTKEVSLNTNIIGEYLWYRRFGGTDTLVGTTTDPKFTITQGGVYYVVIDYGLCGLPKSKFITATEVVAGIGGASVVELCAGDPLTLTATSNFTKYTYEWSLDGDVKQSEVGNNSYDIPTTGGQFGKYTLKIITDDCTSTSAEVELKQKTSASFSITTVDSGESVLLPCETQKAEITGAPSGATIQWFRNDIVLPGLTQFELNLTNPGEYYAIVTDPSSSSSCPATVKSEIYSVYELDSFKVDIRIEDTNYKDCESTLAKLVIVGVKALVKENANEYDLTDGQLNETAPVLIRYQWHKDGNPIATGGTGKEYTVNSYQDNGDYELEVKTCILGTENGKSAKLSIKLAAPLPTVTSVPNSNSLCTDPGSKITYTIDGGLLSGFTYEWFKDGSATAVATNVVDFEVTEIGEYVLKMIGFGCERSIDPIEVVLFDESVVEVTPSVKVVLNQGQTVTVTASGGESYVWHLGQDDTGTILSTNETLDVNALGFYTVVVSVGSCTVTKTIEVVEQDDQIIVPNIVTPNQDGINDTWEISNKYSFQPTVRIQLYNSNGKEILNTTDYQNDWPTESLGNQRVFYYKIIKDDVLFKAGTISVLD